MPASIHINQLALHSGVTAANPITTTFTRPAAPGKLLVAVFGLLNTITTPGWTLLYFGGNGNAVAIKAADGTETSITYTHSSIQFRAEVEEIGAIPSLAGALGFVESVTPNDPPDAVGYLSPDLTRVTDGPNLRMDFFHGLDAPNGFNYPDGEEGLGTVLIAADNGAASGVQARVLYGRETGALAAGTTDPGRRYSRNSFGGGLDTGWTQTAGVSFWVRIPSGGWMIDTMAIG